MDTAACRVRGVASASERVLVVRAASSPLSLRAVSRYDWLLVIHVLGAFAIVTALVLTTALILAARGRRTLDAALLSALARPASILFTAGGVVVLVFGIWLAIDVDAYGITDEWVIGAIVLWLVASYAGVRSTAELSRAAAASPAGSPAAPDVAAPLAAPRRAVLLHLVNVAAVLGLILLMVFKPGAG